MWLLILSFLIVTILMAWLFFGYFLVVWLCGLLRGRKHPQIPEHLPSISIIIPCFNESQQIVKKLDNTRQLDYPVDLVEVIVADGNSTDNTNDLLADMLQQDERYRLLPCPGRGKIRQLNYALTQAQSDIIVISDADALLSGDALKWIAAEFASDDNVSVVGAYCVPADAIKIERYYWDSHNKGRLLESDFASSSIVIAPCYAFRKGFVQAYPDDVIADDVYIAFYAHSRGARVVYSRHAKVMETRNPRTYADFIRHKFRKGNAFLRESLRFLYLLPQMRTFGKIMFTARVFQQLILPWLMILWFLIAGSLLTVFRYDIVAYDLGLLAALFLMTAAIFSGKKLPEGKSRYSIFTMAIGYVITLIIMLITGLTYAFFKQDSCYPRIDGREL